MVRAGTGRDPVYGSGTGQVSRQGGTMTTEANRALVLRFYEEVWNRGNVDAAREVFAPDYVRHDLRPLAALPGPDGQAKIAAEFRAAFPDLRMTVDLIVAKDDLVAARWTTSGTHTGPWADVAPTGAHVTFSGMNVFRVREEGRGALEPSG
jgi:predicted ester cyclase